MDKFLKKTADVPNDFIDDFFNISGDECIKNIDFDIAVKWLNVIKGNLKRLLIDNFEEKYDYNIEKINTKNKNGKGNHYEQILLTPDCFKELCMMSNTEKGRQVRKYYIAIEKLLKQYHQMIDNEINEELGIVKKNQKPKKYDHSGYIYGMPAQNTKNKSLIKLGATSNMNNRLNVYNSGNANNVEPMFAIKVNDVHRVEECVKSMIDDRRYREHKEIYEIDTELLKAVCTKCNELVNWVDICTKHNISGDKEKLLICFGKEGEDNITGDCIKVITSKKSLQKYKNSRKGSKKRSIKSRKDSKKVNRKSRGGSRKRSKKSSRKSRRGSKK